MCENLCECEYVCVCGGVYVALLVSVPVNGMKSAMSRMVANPVISPGVGKDMVRITTNKATNETKKSFFCSHSNLLIRVWRPLH